MEKFVTEGIIKKNKCIAPNIYSMVIEEEEVVVTMTHLGYIKRIPLDTYKQQKRGGRGVIGVNTIQEDFIEKLFTTLPKCQSLV